MDARISMITLGVSDLAAAVTFYESGLHLPRVPPLGDEVAFFKLSGTWLALYPRGTLAEDAGLPEAGGGFRGVALAHNLSSKDAVDAQMAEALAAGAVLVKKPRDAFWGGYSGYFADLDGHLWELAWNPHLWIGPDAET